MNIEQTPDKTMWKSSTDKPGTITYTSKVSGDTLYNIKEMSVNYEIEAFTGYCFHCNKLNTKPITRGYQVNATGSDVKRYAVDLILNKFQVSTAA